MNDDLNKGIELHRKGELDKAEKIYLDLYNINKKDPSLLQLIGTIYLQKKKLLISRRIFFKEFSFTTR